MRGDFRLGGVMKRGGGGGGRERKEDELEARI
jgi:hypothetical protein